MLLKAYGFSEEEPYAFFVVLRTRIYGTFRMIAAQNHLLLQGGFIMACFLVPVAEAVVTTAITKAVKSKEADQAALKVVNNNNFQMECKIPFSRKLKWLTKMLWGGSALLAFEHVWHGEVVPWFPFLTSVSDPAAKSVMLSEMGTVGVSMALVLTAVWGVMLLVTNSMEKKALKEQSASN
jgi:hypothetical protein